MTALEKLLQQAGQQAQTAVNQKKQNFSDLLNKVGTTITTNGQANGLIPQTPAPAPTPDPAPTTPTTPTTPQIPEAAKPTTPTTPQAPEVKPFTPSVTAPTYESTDYAKRLQELGGGTYQPSETVQAAQNYLNNIIANKPGSYESKYTGQLEALYQKIMNREPFSYDINGDALYQQYRDKYTMQGQAAMQDTMGQAAMLTGGYGNSYANTAGMQAYQSYLQQLNDVVPELYAQAYNRWAQEGQNLQDQFALTQAADEAAYGRWLDSYNSWLNDRAYAQGAYESAYSRDYNDYANRLNTAQNILGMEQADAAQKNSNAFNAYLTQLGIDADIYNQLNSQRHDLTMFDKESAYNTDAREDSQQHDITMSDIENEQAKEMWNNTAQMDIYLQQLATQTNKDAATTEMYRELVLRTLEEGGMPDAATLAAAGLTRTDVEAYAKKMGWRDKNSSSSGGSGNSGGASSGSTGNTGTSNAITYEQIRKWLMGV